MRAAREQTTTAALRDEPRAAPSGSAGASDSVAAPAARQGGRWKALLIVAIAGVGLWLAVPRFIGSLLLLPGHQALDLLARGKALTEEGELRARDSRDAARPWHHDRRVLVELATVKLYQALKPGQVPEAADQLIEEAKADLAAGLALAPTDPHAWLQWAYLRSIYRATAEQADTGIRMSIRTGAGERSILVPRAAYALVLWRDLSEETKALMFEQFRTGLAVSPKEFAAMVRALRVEDGMRQYLAANPATGEADVRRLDDALMTLFAGS